jgi:hypothetical protein
MPTTAKPIQLRVLRPLHHGGKVHPAGAVVTLEAAAASDALQTLRAELVNADDLAVVRQAADAAATAAVRSLGAVQKRVH